MAFLAILDQYEIFCFVNFLQNGHWRPFWMSEIHFLSHFWPFQIDTQVYFYWKFLTKWLPSAILDGRNSLSITFLAILDQYGFFFEIFYKMESGSQLAKLEISWHPRGGSTILYHMKGNFAYFSNMNSKYEKSCSIIV